MHLRHPPSYNLIHTSSSDKDTTEDNAETQPEIQIEARDLAVLQRFTDIYYYRLIAAWGTMSGGEDVPPTYTGPPDISEWSANTLAEIVINFEYHLEHFQENTPEDLRTSVNELASNLQLLITDYTFIGIGPGTPWHTYYRDMIVESLGTIEQELQMGMENQGPLWVDLGAGQEEALRAEREDAHDVPIWTTVNVPFASGVIQSNNCD
ncbi:hypothetical protein EDC01DRAFT_784858 [Geopyxis carbonaria]|nr:hypothetical protein EDC01DRAFT_784858 [Geopyxis carbonaria]